MKPALFLPVILLYAASLHAQYTPPHQNANQSFGVAGMEGLGTSSNPIDQKLTAEAQKLAAAELEHAVSRCPIAMEARQGGRLHILRAQKDEKTSSQPFMSPSLTLHNPQDQRIVSASVTALGSGPNKGTTLLQARERKHDDDDSPGEFLYRVPNPDSSPRPLLTRTLTVQFASGDNNTVSGDLYLPGFVLLDSITLNAVTFADGSTQSFASNSGCRATPSPLMLVGMAK
ncbi:hypothetical protein [Terracidiphilus gabretensis]|uniref:hypothetical protein n=1 Tax=Terracidiphilus gabretensis TaxID=1577687 RepID=UPI00071B193E|nr:hypothetical protein [Terracidiphilus gabretensis]